jgi:predicted nucleic acid-binding protein
VIIADSSVWIDHFRGRRTRQSEHLRMLLELGYVDKDPRHDLLVGDLILLEILLGARTEEDAIGIFRILTRFHFVALLTPDLAVLAIRHFRALRAVGKTCSGLNDLVIATFCIAHGHSLLHADRDFDVMEKYLDLKVVAATWSVNDSRAAYGGSEPVSSAAHAGDSR